MTYAELVPPTIPRLRWYAGQLSSEMRDDLVQETLLRALQAWHTRDSTRALTPWLYTIMRNHYFDSRRIPQRWKHDVELSVESGGVGTGLPAALNKLPSKLWKVLVLSEVYEMADSEIGESLQLSKNTVRSRKRYALVTLRKLLRVEPA